MEWKTIEQFPDYAISDMGIVMRIANGSNTWPGRILQAVIDKDGYRRVGLFKNKKKSVVRIAILVLKGFKDDLRQDTEANHKSGIKIDDSLKNLEWVTHQENMTHAFALGLRSYDYAGENNPKAKLKEWQIKEIRGLISIGKSCVSIARMFNVTDVLIGLIKRKKIWLHI